MPLERVIACATVNAARVFEAFNDRGTLNVGAPADVAVLELRDGTFEFVDNYDGKRTGPQRLFPSATVLGGKRVPPVMLKKSVGATPLNSCGFAVYSVECMRRRLQPQEPP